MTALVGGLVAVALGLIGLGLWWREFLGLLAGGRIGAVAVVIVPPPYRHGSLMPP